MSLIGASALHARLNALIRVPSLVEREWGEATVPIMRGYIPHRTGKTAASLRPANDGIFGSPVINFLDSGTRAHDEEAHGQALKFTTGGETFFRKKVHKPQTRGQDFKRKAEKQGLDEVSSTLVVDTWNRAA